MTSLPTPTAVQHAVASLVRLVLVQTAHSLLCSHLLLGTSLTSLSISLIDSIAQGGGFNLSDESYEECPPSGAAVGRSLHSLRVVRPLRDISMKECAAWMYWHGVEMACGIPDGLEAKPTIHALTKGAYTRIDKRGKLG